MPRPRTLPIIALLLASCASPNAPRPARPSDARPDPTAPRTDADTGQWGERLLVEVAAIPGVWLTRDRDDGSRTHTETGSGAAARLATGNRDQSVGVLYQHFDTDGGAIDADTLSIDFDARTPLDADSARRFFLRAGASIGGAWLDVPGADPGPHLNAQLRLGVDFRPAPWLQLGTSFGGIVFGHPGETEAYGTLLSIGGALVF